MDDKIYYQSNITYINYFYVYVLFPFPFYHNDSYLLIKLVSLTNSVQLSDYNIFIKNGLNIFFLFLFVVFVVDDPHFDKDKMFKIVIILSECLKWSSFSQFVFYLVIFCDVV